MKICRISIFYTLVTLTLVFCHNTFAAGAIDIKAFATPQTILTDVPVVEKGNPEDIRLTSKLDGTWQEAYPETGMTFIEYVTSNAPRPTTEKKYIYLLPYGNFDSSIQFRKVAKLVSAFFSLPVKVMPQKNIPSNLYNKMYRKYDADQILLEMRNNLPKDAFAYAAITDKDMFSGRLSAVFGLAYCDLRSCVISTARTCANSHKIGGKREFVRIFKLLTHEICHVIGLPHCSAHKCLMNGTMSLSDVDNAPLTLCGPCLKKLQWNIGFDMLERYRNISNALSTLNITEGQYALATRIDRLKNDDLNDRLESDILAYNSKKKINTKASSFDLPELEQEEKIVSQKKTAEINTSNNVLASVSKSNPVIKQKPYANIRNTMRRQEFSDNTNAIEKLKNLRNLSPAVLSAAKTAAIRNLERKEASAHNSDANLVAARMEDLW